MVKRIKCHMSQHRVLAFGHSSVYISSKWRLHSAQVPEVDDGFYLTLCCQQRFFFLDILQFAQCHEGTKYQDAQGPAPVLRQFII